jgi:G3E family GTPase
MTVLEHKLVSQSTSNLFPTVASAKLPVSVITGFLGSGKTTLLNKLLMRPEMANTVVIINEFGEVPLDGALIGSQAGEVVTLANGCMCCVVGDDFESAMGNLYRSVDYADGASMKRILIETSGLADPAPIIGSLLNSPMMASWCVLDSVITTVDAAHGLKQIEEHPEALSQIAFADRLVVTKSDLVPPDRVTRIEMAIRHWNQHGKVIVVNNGEVRPAELLGVQTRDGKPNAAHFAEIMPRISANSDHHGHEHEAGHHHTPLVRAFAIVEPKDLDWRVFNNWFRKLRIKHGDDLLRVKGILKIRGESKPVVVHGVRHIFHPPAALESWQGLEPGSRLVFIVRGAALEHKILEGFRLEVANSGGQGG